MKLWEKLNRDYKEYEIKKFDNRFLPYILLKEFLDLKYLHKISLGKSFLGKDIFALKWGNGPLKILIWSQMHGNETTGTRAMFDVLEFLNSNENEIKDLIKKITIHFIPMLNPDGADTYSRRNAYGIDLNRDFLQESSPEIKILKNYVSLIKPNFLFNLHDQRSVFNVGNTPKSSVLSFLAPSTNEKRSLTQERIESMFIIEEIYSELGTLIPGHISRFSDEFYAMSTGDNFMKLGFPCTLIEAGHFPDDYNRNKVRKYNALALLLAFEKIAQNEKAEVGNYFKIPENNKLFLDIILRNVCIQSNHTEVITDIGIYFIETLHTENKRIEFISRIEQIGDLSKFHGHLDVDVKNALYKGLSSPYPILEEYADFSVAEYHFEKGRFKG